MEHPEKDELIHSLEEGEVSNRRAAERSRLRFRIFLHIPDRAEKNIQGVVSDISAYGLLFSSATKLDVGTRLFVMFDSLPGDRRHRKISSVVTRSEIGEGGAEYLTGVKFIDLDEISREDIQAALQHTDIVGLLVDSAEAGASDLHLSANHPPIIRVAGSLQPLRDDILSGPDIRDMVYTLLDASHREVFERDLDLNLSIPVNPLLRYRVNVHLQRGNVEAAFRRIEPAARSFSELSLPPVLKRFAEFRDGLILLTGTTGAGKTTTATAILEHINATRTAVIVTLESPIEYLYKYEKSVIKQREVGLDTRSYADGLREAMRQDPDVIFIGEIRDQDTMKITLDAAETGHLVLATMPAADSVQSILRTFHFFPKDRQKEVQLQLAGCLRGIICQRLLQRVNGDGVVPATEILVSNEAVSNIIRGGNLEQIPSALQTGGALGMHTLASSVEKLVKEGKVSLAAAQEYR